jgi:predicted nuclease with TOPRIM domain
MEQEKRREQERLKAVQAENDRLRKEKEELERQADQPHDEVLRDKIQGGSSQVGVEREVLQIKNKEIEQLIDQVLKSQAQKSGDQVPQD